MEPLPLGLSTALESGQCVLFVGAGIGVHGVDPAGRPSPDGAALARELSECFKLGLDDEDATSLSTVAQLVEIRRGRPDLHGFLTERLANIAPDGTLQWLFGLTWKAIFTTNWDGLIQRAYDLNPNPVQTPVTITNSAGVVGFDPRFEVPVYHLHGSLFAGEEPFALVTEQDYARFTEKRRMLFDIFKTEYARNPILYVGYSLRDPNWKLVTAELRAELTPGRPPTSYRLAPSTTEVQRELLSAQGVEEIQGTLAEFQTSVESALGDLRVDPRDLETMEQRIPVDLQPAFNESPASVARLVNSWDYVNGADFAQHANLDAYLSGDHPNWGLIGRDLTFERDLTETVFDELLDFATDASRTGQVISVLAPAGYGVTTVLMTLAGRIVMERAGWVFFHRRGAQLLEGDIEFAASLAAMEGASAFFVVDNAADFDLAIAATSLHLRQAGLRTCLVLGERLNEWRQKRERISSREHAIEPLSDGEIDRLLDYLENHDSLGVLADLDVDLRIAAIKQKHRQELLITMKEATEGKGFATIIEDEYRGIGDDFSRLAYSTICGLYRHRVMPRDELLAKVLEVNVVDLYDRTRATLAGVVVWETIDESRSIHAARARHHVIADVVWQSATPLTEQSSVLLKMMSALNLNYYSDAKAYESLVRSDDVVDSIRGLDGKTRFFELAIAKDPDSPYVRQHFARMLLREDRPELALDAIDKAIAMDGSIRVLHHTRGLILKEISTETESQEVARRRMRQAEESFLTLIDTQPRDGYGYHGLASLYFMWSKRRQAASSEESAEFLEMAEDTISRGIRTAGDPEALWVLSADLHEWLGDNPSAIAALEMAVESSETARLGRYLLARQYRRSGDPQKAIETIKPVIKESPEEFRACIVHALALNDLGAPLRESIAVLQLGDLTGRRNPRYIAILGGMLTMDKQLSKAAEIFRASREREFSYQEAHRIEWTPLGDGGELLRLSGEVTAVKTGFSFVAVPGYSDFFCPGSKYGGVRMVKDLRVEFTPGFSARGPVVTDPAVADR